MQSIRFKCGANNKYGYTCCSCKKTCWNITRTVERFHPLNIGTLMKCSIVLGTGREPYLDDDRHSDGRAERWSSAVLCHHGEVKYGARVDGHRSVVERWGHLYLTRRSIDGKVVERIAANNRVGYRRVSVIFCRLSRMGEHKFKKSCHIVV